MQITTKTEYSVRALIEIALQNGVPISLREICHRQHLPEKYMEQLFRRLKKEQILLSIPGSKGGYKLAKPAAEITMHNIMQAVEDGAYQPFCEGKQGDSSFCLGNPCVLQLIWSDIHTHTKSYLETLTLATILDRIKESSHDTIPYIS